MDTIVTSIRLACKPKLLPSVVQGTSERVGRRLRRISGTEHLSTKILPRQIQWIPLDDEVVDGRARCHKLVAHGHEKTIEDIEVLNLGTVEASSKFHKRSCLLGLIPHLTQSVCIHCELCACICSVHYIPSGQCICPANAELVLELAGRHVQLVWREQRSFGGNRVVVVINELHLIDDVAVQLCLALDGEALLFQLLLKKFFDFWSQRMWFNEDQCDVLKTSRECSNACNGLTHDGASICVSVFQSVVDGGYLAEIGDLWIQ
mmetsp:Transcript_125108/g.216781  ORF Transcript_125108/g.216781 Transcript_125108/m.216781 type:complete len:262 (+) Transcript_125108:569-1354(+)